MLQFSLYDYQLQFDLFFIVIGIYITSTSHGEYVCNVIQRPLWQKGNEDFDGGS